jgi:hypothetical protein
MLQLFHDVGLKLRDEFRLGQVDNDKSIFLKKLGLKIFALYF